jgi:large subunit ribosomal protein L5
MKTETIPIPKLFDKYRKGIIPSMMHEFGYRNVMQVPKVTKVVINMGIKEGKDDIKILEQLASELALITGQKPLVTRAKKSISGFKLRQGSPVGVKVTLRRAPMYEFMERLFNIAMPRIRDFRGYSSSGFDSHGNFSVGLHEQIIFPEVEYDKVKKIQGMNITFVTTAYNQKEGKRLLELLGLPFKKD